MDQAPGDRTGPPRPGQRFKLSQQGRICGGAHASEYFEASPLDLGSRLLEAYIGVRLVLGLVPSQDGDLGPCEIEAFCGPTQACEGQAIAADLTIELRSVAQSGREKNFVGKPCFGIRICTADVACDRSLCSRHGATLMSHRGIQLAATSLELGELALSITLDLWIIGQDEIERGRTSPPARPLYFAIGFRARFCDPIARHDHSMMNKT